MLCPPSPRTGLSGQISPCLIRGGTVPALVVRALEEIDRLMASDMPPPVALTMHNARHMGRLGRTVNLPLILFMPLADWASIE